MGERFGGKIRCEQVQSAIIIRRVNLHIDREYIKKDMKRKAQVDESPAPG